MPDYNVNRPVKLDGKIHKPGGKPITVDAETAAPAVESGALAEVVTDAPPKAELEIGNWPDAVEAGEQIDGQGLPPAAEVKAAPEAVKKAAPKKKAAAPKAAK